MQLSRSGRCLYVFSLGTGSLDEHIANRFMKFCAADGFTELPVNFETSREIPFMESQAGGQDDDCSAAGRTNVPEFSCDLISVHSGHIHVKQGQRVGLSSVHAFFKLLN